MSSLGSPWSSSESVDTVLDWSVPLACLRKVQKQGRYTYEAQQSGSAVLISVQVSIQTMLPRLESMALGTHVCTKMLVLDICIAVHS